jgi:iron-sulfur cluster repair protein YtfE (RIC family)
MDYNFMTEMEGFLDREHSELLEQMSEIAAGKGKVAELYGEILSIFSYHLDKEEETVIPLLAYLKSRSTARSEVGFHDLESASRKFIGDAEEMISEHREMAQIIEKVASAKESGSSQKAAEIGRSLLHHVELEEEILYPAAEAACELLALEKNSTAGRQVR